MAKVVLDEQKVIVQPWWAKEKSIYAGLGLGVIWCVFSWLITQYIVNPLACRNLSSAETCANSVAVGGNIALILVAVLGVLVLVRLFQARPIIVVTATTIVLWGLAGLTEGLAWYWGLLAAALLFGISYALFALIVRIRSLGAAVAIALIVSVGIRLLLTL